jgi:hypothetical protein
MGKANPPASSELALGGMSDLRLVNPVILAKEMAEPLEETIVKKITILSALGLIAAVLAIGSTFLYARETTPPHIKEMRRIAGMFKETEPAFTVQEAEAFAKDLLPLVKKLAGKRFHMSPTIKLVNRDVLEQTLVRDFLPQYRNVMKPMKEHQILQSSKAQARGIAPFLLGKYGFEDKILYLMPRNVVPIFQLAKIDQKHIRSILKMIIAHELTHVLQDQEIDLGVKFRNVEGLEELDALNATIEGHAVFIQELVGKQLKLNEEILEASRRLIAGSVKFNEPALEMARKRASVRFEQIYLGGMRFIEYHYRKGGNQRIWEILAEPPAETSMITKPETYSPVHTMKLDYAKILQGLEEIEWLSSYFRRRKFSICNCEVTTFRLRSTYANLDSEKREELISKIEHIQTFEATKKGLAGSFSLILLKDYRYGHKYISTVEKMATKNIERMKKGTMYKIADLSLADFPGIKADIARRLSFSLKSSSGGKQRHMAVRICRGEVMVEISSMNIPLHDDQIIEMAQKIFQGYRKAKEQRELRRPQN